MKLKDIELRGIILQKFYEKRRDGLFQWKTEDFADLDPSIDFDHVDLYRACDQLFEHGLIEWKTVRDAGVTLDGRGQITARGVDVVEGATKSPISIVFEDKRQTINIHNSANFQVGNKNTQSVTIALNELAKAIDSSDASEDNKQEARSILSSALAHPMVNTVVGGISQIGAAIFSK